MGDLFSSSLGLDSLFSGGTPSLFGTDGTSGSSTSEGGTVLGKQLSSSTPSPFDLLNSFMGSSNVDNNPTAAATINPLSAFGDIGNLLNMGNCCRREWWKWGLR